MTLKKAAQGLNPRVAFVFMMCMLFSPPLMEDTFWSEIADAPGEIWDIPEMQDEEEDETSWNQFVNGNVTL